MAAGLFVFLPYENNTNDEQLDMLGNMAEDWITRTLMNLQDVRIVQFENVKYHLGILQEGPDQFVNRTGTEKMIKGSFYLEGDELIFESHIVNPQTLEVIYALQELFESDPKHFLHNFQYGSAALGINLPRKAVDCFQQLDPYAFKFEAPVEYWWFSHYAAALVRLGRYQEAMNIISIVPDGKNRYRGICQHIYTLQNQADSLENALSEIEEKGADINDLAGFMFKIAWNYLHGYPPYEEFVRPKG